MQVKYAKPWSIAFLVLGLVSLGLGSWLIMLTGELSPSLFTAGLLIVIGLLGLLNPFYVLRDGILQARNLLGMTLFRHPIEKLSVQPGAKPDERRLFVIKNAGKGKKKRIMSNKSLFFDRKQVNAIIDAVAGQQAF